jgi:hypothetical protein
MSDHLAELNLWKALAQDPAWDSFVAPCSCYEDALHQLQGIDDDEADVPEKEIRPKLQFTTPGDYPILVCEYCGHDVIGETIEQCIAKHNAAMHEYDLVASGSIWEGKPAWYPVTEQMVTFGFKMAIMDVNQDVWSDAMKVFESKGWVREGRWCKVHMGKECEHKYAEEIILKRANELLRSRVDQLEAQMKEERSIDGKTVIPVTKREQESTSAVISKAEMGTDEVVRTPRDEEFNTTFTETAERLGKTADELREVTQRRTDTPQLSNIEEDESKKPKVEEDKDKFFTCLTEARKAQAVSETKTSVTNKLRAIFRACINFHNVVLRTGHYKDRAGVQSAVIMCNENNCVYKIHAKYNDSMHATGWAYTVEPYTPGGVKGFSSSDLGEDKNNHAMLCCLTRQPDGSEWPTWYAPVNLQADFAIQNIPSSPTLACCILPAAETATAEQTPQKENKNA